MCFGQFELKCRHTDTYGSLRKIKLIWTFLEIEFLEKFSIFHLSLSANHMPLHDENFERLLVELEWKNLISECYFSGLSYETDEHWLWERFVCQQSALGLLSFQLQYLCLVWPCTQLFIWSPLTQQHCYNDANCASWSVEVKFCADLRLSTNREYQQLITYKVNWQASTRK